MEPSALPPRRSKRKHHPSFLLLSSLSAPSCPHPVCSSNARFVAFSKPRDVACVILSTLSCIRWEAVAKCIQTTHKLKMNARECQQLWKFLAYGQIPSEQSEETKLLPDSDEEDFHRTPRGINAKLAAQRASAEAEKNNSEDAVKVSEQVKTPVTETAAKDVTAEVSKKSVTEKESVTEVPDKQETKAAAAAATAKETADEAPDNSVGQTVKVSDKSVAQTTVKEVPAEAPDQPKAQTAAEEAPTDEASKPEVTDRLPSQDNDGTQEEESEPPVRLYPTYTLPMGAPDSWHRPFNPKKSLPLTFVASRFLKRKPQPVSTKPVGGGPATKAVMAKLPSSSTAGVVMAGAARPSAADLKRKQVAPTQSAAGIKKKKIEISPSAAVYAAPRAFTPSSTPPPAAKRARTQLEFFELHLREERAKAQDRTKLTVAEIQRRYGEASVQVRRECQELAVHDIERYNRELIMSGIMSINRDPLITLVLLSQLTAYAQSEKEVGLQAPSTGADYENLMSPALSNPSITKRPDLEAGDDYQPQGASFWILLAVSMPRMAVNMAWAAQWAALGPYLSTMLPNYAVQLTSVIGPVVGIIFGPIIGVLSDRNTSRYGRRRPILVVMGVLSIVCWIAMAYTTEIGTALGDVGTGAAGEKTDRTWTAVFTLIFYLWMDITVTCSQTPTMLMVADFAGERQTLGAALGLGWATMGAIIPAVYIQIWGAAYLTLKYFMAMLCVVMFVCVVVAVVFGKETPLRKTKNVDICQSVGDAFKTIYTGVKTMPPMLTVYAAIMFFVLYGYSAYNGNKGQFFGLVVYGGNANNADSCNPCSAEQIAYNHGVRKASGLGDLLFNIVGYVYSWMLPFLVRQFGARWVLSCSMLAQALLMPMAFCTNVGFDLFVVAVLSVAQGSAFALMVPSIIHVFGRSDIDIGMYVGALNSANCFGQLLNYAIGTAVVQTSLGYKLPVFLGGVMSFIGFFVGALLFRVKMHSM
ncbi:hypothetical protein BBO99_00004399 [Phytophthora kernoviae]|uniref:Major facilitator superfamily (MFS) profile domain-containing protein n=2 Tax=Phytophthora kernoviae TaxID=325452 RepID=A0A3R7HJ70_9STRA|nr:hypothetical protein G195_011035 [Phytophthora kernoviae 00238/432]KAG2506948.1 hypothetical protein JM16_009083 [Phytophthora kernoviae]KAG2507429.1 hypothetical protein JM18_009165 [Phytophthora kernoviae]RLN38317.1 hypothetical protein BBI17_004778 [Phytophthora kernoviae]RLN80541.1 hypothetical protein BBO99_00004399 [Phytophthora kernoviae]